MIYAISALLALSLGVNVALFLKTKSLIKAPVPTTEAKELLASLMSGQAIVRISVLDPESLILRSPRK